MKAKPMTDAKTRAKRDPSVVQRVAQILQLFSEASPIIETKDAEVALGVSQATAYRYMRDMHDAGLLSRSAGYYMPGPKIIELDDLIRRFDPLIIVARDPMRDLFAKTGCEVLLGRLYDLRLVNVLGVGPTNGADLNFAPGRTVPLFRGSQARAVLAAMDRRTRRRVFDLGEGDPNRDFVGTDWPSFNKILQKNKAAGHYVSNGELDRDVTGVAAPILDENGNVLGSLVAAWRDAMALKCKADEMVPAVIDHAACISAALQERLAQCRMRRAQEI